MRTKIINNKRFFAWTILNFATSFMFCVFAPIDAFFANAEEFWFSLYQMLPICFMSFIVFFIASECIAYFLCKLKVSDVFFSITIAATICFYIQGNYIPRAYGVLDGKEIDWSKFSGYSIASVVLALAGIGLAVLLLFRLKRHLNLIGKSLGGFLLLVQAVTMAVLIAQNSTSVFAEVITPSSEDAFDLSQSKNIVVFLLDTYDGDDFRYLLENDFEEQTEIFENFTFYEDTLGAYPTTKCAVPYMLTGEWYENEEPYQEYLEDAFAKNKILEAFRKNKWEINLYTNVGLPIKTKVFDNVAEEASVGNRFLFASKICKLVAFNYMPHQLKKYFFIYTNEFDETSSNAQESVIFASAVKFNNRLNENGITLSKAKKCVKFYHLSGVHAPYTFNENIEEDNGEYTSYDEAAGNNQMLKQYFNEMKEKGIYDSSTIIVMADHGHINYSQNPIFLIKNAGEKHGFYKSESPMSWEYLKDIWVALANEISVDETFVESRSCSLGARRYMFYVWDDSWDRHYMPAMEEMLCEGVAYNPTMLKTTGRLYYPLGEDHSYKMEESLDFISSREGNRYVVYGMANGRLMNDARLAFDINGEYKNISIKAELSEHSNSQLTKVYANNLLVAYDNLGADGNEINIIIPREYVENGHLDLEFVQGEKTDNAKFISSGLIIRTLVISSTTERADLDSQICVPSYNLGTALGFSVDNKTANSYMVGGFSQIESWGTWTLGNMSEMMFSNIGGDDNLIMECSYTTFDGMQHIRVYGNNAVLDEFDANGEETRRIFVPKSVLNEGTLFIRIELPDARSPYDIGVSDDKRKIALGFHSMKIRKAETYSLGKAICFDENSNYPEAWVLTGFSKAEDGFAWTSGNDVRLTLQIEKCSKDLILLVETLNTFNGKQHVETSVNGETLESFTVDGKSEFKVRIPARYTKDGVLAIDFHLPDAISPHDLEISDDMRMLALAVKSINLIEE